MSFEGLLDWERSEATSVESSAPQLHIISTVIYY